MCVYTVNEDYRSGGSASAEERAELLRIRQEGHKAKLSVGTVHAYVLTPDGRTHDSLHVAKAARTAELYAMLERAIAKFQPEQGKPVVAPVPQCRPPMTKPDDLVLHLISRADQRGSWGEFPGEDWIVLPKDQWARLLPQGQVKIGQSWKLDQQVGAEILRFFYPQTENNKAPASRIEQHTLKAKVISVQDGTITARIDGTLKMNHVFYPGRKDAQPIDAVIVGLLTFAADRAQPPSLKLATSRATHGKRSFAVAVVPHAAQ